MQLFEQKILLVEINLGVLFVRWFSFHHKELSRKEIGYQLYEYAKGR